MADSTTWSAEVLTKENSGGIAMKKAEDSDALVFHLYEWAGKAGTVELKIPHGATGATETNLMEQPEGNALAIDNDRIRVAVRPFEILAVRVDYPHQKQ
jgi:alpha-mannosidase